MSKAEFLGRIKNPVMYIEDERGHPQTHRMRAEYNDNTGEWIAFPTIVMTSTGRLHQFPESQWRDAMRNAIRTNNYISFGKDKSAALEYAEGAYKRGTPLEMDQDAFKAKYKRQNGAVEQ